MIVVDNHETVAGIKCTNVDTVLRPEWLAYSLATMLISQEHTLCQVGFPGGPDGKESACHAGNPRSIPGSGKSLGKGHGNPHQSSCLENSMDRGACGATIHGVGKSQT